MTGTIWLSLLDNM